MIVRALFALIPILCLPLAALAQAPEKRVALVIGNSNYASTTKLPNAARDARTMAAALTQVGFIVEPLQIDLSRDVMEQRLSAFAAKARDADVALIYYAGHGIELENNNYLVPVDANYASPNDVDDFTAIPLDRVMKSVTRAKRLKIVILDACRNNPFESRWSAAKVGGAKRSFGARGLAPVEPGGETLIAYAAKAGRTAADGGANDNSPFVKALTKYLPRPGLEIGYLFRLVRDEVLVATRGDQEPFTYGSLGKQQFFFVPEGQKVVGPDPAIGKKPGESFRDCTGCPEMVIVPAGKFVMGSPATEKDRSDDEGPQREVTFAKPFAVGKFEVTFAEWDACVKDGGCKERAKKDRWGRGKQPLINVSWDEAQDYLEWIKKFTGRKYRLLSESEWEYAARAGSTTAYWWGPEIGKGNANCDGCGGQWDGKQTSPAGSFKPNKFGLFDMHGNVWEWVEDCWNENYNGAPVDGSARTTGEWCGLRVIRGGSWYYDPRFLRSADRVGSNSEVRNDYVGFRVARTL